MKHYGYLLAFLLLGLAACDAPSPASSFFSPPLRDSLWRADSLRAEETYVQGRNLLGQDIARAMSVFQEASALFKKLQLDEQQAVALAGIAYGYVANAHLDSAAACLSQAEKIAGPASGWQDLRTGALPSTRALLHTAQEQPFLAAEQAAICVRHLEKFPPERSVPNRLSAYTTLMGACMETGELESARLYQEKGMSLFEELAAQGHPLAANPRTLLSLRIVAGKYALYSQSPEEAAPLLREAVALAALLPANLRDVQLQAESQANLALALLEAGHYGEALVQAQRLEQEGILSLPEHRLMTRTVMARALLGQDKPQEALAALRAGIAQQQPGADTLAPAVLAAAYEAQGGILSRLGQQEAALEAYRSALFACSFDSSRQDFPAPASYFAPHPLARIFWGLLRLPLPDAERLRHALYADSVVRHQLVALRMDKSRLAWVQDLFPVYEAGIAAALRLHQQSGQAIYAEQAFQLSEDSKALLSNALFREATALSASLPESLRRELAYVASRLRQYSAGRISPGEAFAAQQQYDSLLQEINQYGDYQQLAVQSFAPQALSAARQALRGRALIEYFAGDSVLYRFVLTSDSLRFESLGATQELSRWAEAWQASLLGGQDSLPALAMHGRDGYARLLKGSEALVGEKALCIVPDGVLHQVAFEALLTGEAPGLSCRQWPFLIRRQAVSYAGSAALWRQQESVRPRYRRVLAISPGAADPAPIPASGRLAEALPGRYGGACFTGPEATRTQLYAWRQDVAVFFAGAHGALNSTAPDSSYLLLAGDQGQKLRIEDLHLLPFDADLASLALCHSGQGAFLRGEGPLSLVRALTSSGTPAALMGLWELDDAHTSDMLLPRFFEGLAGGADKAEALRAAKRFMIEEAGPLTTDSDPSHPYYWSGITLTGNVQPLKLGNNRPFWIAGALAILFLLGILLQKRLQRR